MVCLFTTWLFYVLYVLDSGLLIYTMIKCIGGVSGCLIGGSELH